MTEERVSMSNSTGRFRVPVFIQSKRIIVCAEAPPARSKNTKSERIKEMNTILLAIHPLVLTGKCLKLIAEIKNPSKGNRGITQKRFIIRFLFSPF